MKSLLSMTDFVLQDKGNILNIQYAKFLKQPIELWMFVPCDEVGNVLENKSCNFSCSPSDFSENGKCGLNGCYNQSKQYQQAKERVLFEGFKFKRETEISYILIEDDVYTHSIPKNKKRSIENLIGLDNLTLTKTALKKIGL